MTVTAPSAGVMVVRACGRTITSHTNGRVEYLEVALGESESEPMALSAPKRESLNAPREAPSGGIEKRFCIEGHFPVIAGPKTFYLRAYKGPSSEFWSLESSYISALFVASALP
jgi:hypothetical protein